MNSFLPLACTKYHCAMCNHSHAESNRSPSHKWTQVSREKRKRKKVNYLMNNRFAFCIVSPFFRNFFFSFFLFHILFSIPIVQAMWRALGFLRQFFACNNCRTNCFFFLSIFCWFVIWTGFYLPWQCWFFFCIFLLVRIFFIIIFQLQFVVCSLFFLLFHSHFLLRIAFNLRCWYCCCSSSTVKLVISCIE